MLSTLDHGARRKNIIIEGLPFTMGEYTKDVAYAVLSTLEPRFEYYDIDLAYRQGAPTSSTRKLVVVLTKGDLRDKLLALKGSLKNHPRYSNVYLTEDSNN